MFRITRFRYSTVRINRVIRGTPVSRALSVLFVVGQITNRDRCTTSDARNIYDWPDHCTTQVARMARRLRELVYVFGPKFWNVNRRIRG